MKLRSSSLNRDSKIIRNILTKNWEKLITWCNANKKCLTLPVFKFLRNPYLLLMTFKLGKWELRIQSNSIAKIINVRESKLLWNLPHLHLIIDLMKFHQKIKLMWRKNKILSMMVKVSYLSVKNVCKKKWKVMMKMKISLNMKKRMRMTLSSRKWLMTYVMIDSSLSLSQVLELIKIGISIL